MPLYVVRHREVHDKYIEAVAEHQGVAVKKVITALRSKGVEAKAGELKVVETLDLSEVERVSVEEGDE